MLSRLRFLDGDDPDSRLPKIRGFTSILALLIAVESWCRALALWDQLEPIGFATLGGATLFAAASLVPGWRRPAFALLFVNQIVVVAHDFPIAGNHAYLEVLLCGLVALLDENDDEEQVILLRSVRWIVCVVLIASGLQKLIHGYWFDGQQLAYSLWIPSFRPVLETVLPPEEFARLLAFRGAVGDGPYSVQSPAFVALSNAIYVAEIILAVLLAVRATRVFAVVATFVMLLAIEAGAREVFFGLNFANALLLFLPFDVHRPAVAVAGAVSVLLLLVRLHVLPDAVFY